MVPTRDFLLELALVKVTPPGSDLSLESLAFRSAWLEEGRAAAPAAPRAPRSPDAGSRPSPVGADRRALARAASPTLTPTRPRSVAPTPAPKARNPCPNPWCRTPGSELGSGPGSDPSPRPVQDDLQAPAASLPAANAGLPALGLEQLQDAWRRTVLPALERRSIPASVMLREARPAELSGDTLTLEFPLTAAFHREKAEEPKTADLLVEALFEVTGRRLQLAYATGAPPAETGRRPRSPGDRAGGSSGARQVDLRCAGAQQLKAPARVLQPVGGGTMALCSRPLGLQSDHLAQHACPASGSGPPSGSPSTSSSSPRPTRSRLASALTEVKERVHASAASAATSPRS